MNHHTQIIDRLVVLGVAVSPFMNYWSLSELLRYWRRHTGIHLNHS